MAMATVYRVVGEAVVDGKRQYRFEALYGGERLTRSCESSESPFLMAATYTREQIDELCPESSVPEVESEAADSVRA